MLADRSCSPEHAEARCSRVPVERHEPAPWEQDLPAAGELAAGLRDRDPAGQEGGGTELRADGDDRPGRSRASALIAAGSARGSVPVTSTTAAPAACAVAVTAAIDALDVAAEAAPPAAAVTRTATRLSGAGVRVAGSAAAERTTFTPGSRAASSRRPGRGQALGQHRDRVKRPGRRGELSQGRGADRAGAVAEAASSTGACAARASASAALSAGPPVPDTTTTGALVNSVRANAAVSAPGAVSARTESAAGGPGHRGQRQRDP